MLTVPPVLTLKPYTSEATQLRLLPPIYFWCPLSHCLSAGAQDDCLWMSEWMSEWVNPLRTHLGFLQLSIPPGQSESPPFFTGNVVRILLLAPAVWAGEGGLGWGALLLQGELCNQDISPESQPPYKGLGPTCFLSTPFLPFLTWLFLYILSYKLLFS